MSNLLQRTLSGIIYLVIIIGALFLGKYAYAVVFLFAGTIALFEYYKLSGIGLHSLPSITGIVIGISLFILSYLIASATIPPVWLSIMALLLVISFGQALFLKDVQFGVDHAKALTGVLYIFVPWSMMNCLVFIPVPVSEFTHRVMLGVLTLVWLNDTAAYVTGSLFGKHKLFPRISPKKSWEGFAGGTVFTMATGFWMDRIMGILTTGNWLWLAMIVCVFGVLGDLTESLIKRNANVKDSGNIIPGHGGVLDRIDSLLFVIPVSVVYLLLS